MSMLKILPANPKANYLAHKNEIDQAVMHVLNSDTYILGHEVENFEKEFAAYNDVSFAIGVGSGTDALHLALRACGVGVGDEVITVSHTAVATVSAIELCGAKPVFVDIDLSTYTMDLTQVESAISLSTKVIVPVHLYGYPVDIGRLREIIGIRDIKIIEDCAQSIGADYKNKKTGSVGDIAAFSFYPTKNLGAIGDGGCVLTNIFNFAQRIRLLREYGWQKRYVSLIAGVNSRLDEIQAAILRVKLKYVDDENKKRQKIAALYTSRLSKFSGIVLPVLGKDVNHVYHQYVIRVKKRDSLRDFLCQKEIGSLIHYPVPIHLQPAYQGKKLPMQGLINTEKAAAEILSLPIYPELSSSDVEFVCDAIEEWFLSQHE